MFIINLGSSILLKRLQMLVLITHIIHEMLNVLVFHYLLVKQVLPYAVKLEFSRLNLAVY